jgi:hypothetical protein
MPHSANLLSVTLPSLGPITRGDLGWTEWECPKCRGDLDLVQPDSDRPDRLIGVCRECRTLILAEMDDDSNTIALAALPERLPLG